MYPDNGFAAAITELKDTLSNGVSKSNTNFLLWEGALSELFNLPSYPFGSNRF